MFSNQTRVIKNEISKSDESRPGLTQAVSSAVDKQAGCRWKMHYCWAKTKEEEEGGEGMLGGSERKGKVGCMDSKQEEDHRED